MGQSSMRGVLLFQFNGLKFCKSYPFSHKFDYKGE